MKNIIFASILALASSSAFAADVVYEAPQAPEAVATTAFTWSGGYGGIGGGAGWLDGEFTDGTTSIDDNFDGGLITGFLGWNWQFDNNVVLGVEGDVSYNWNENSYGDVDIGTDLSGSVRGRVGYAIDKALIYGTAGWTATRGYIDADAVGEEKETFNGYTVGAGIDYAFTSNVFGRAEYRFNDFGSKDIGGLDADLQQHNVIIGVGVKF